MKVTVLTGGVGGAKLVLGLCHAVAPTDITAIVNTGDDFSHMGLAISPDVDTLLYTLADKGNKELGWGRAGETWTFMTAVRELGGEDWFNLGDGDLALHVLRTDRLRRGEILSSVIADFALRWGLEATILPMTDDSVATSVDTDEGLLDFQNYFVRRRCEPAVRGIHFTGTATAHPAPGVIAAIAEAEAILIAPSNPFLSVDPILAVPGIRAALADAAAPVVVVSPIVGGEAVKGPTAKLMREMGLEVSSAVIADHYGGVIDGMLLDVGDPAFERALPHAREDTLMKTLEDRVRVAKAALELAARLA